MPQLTRRHFAMLGLSTPDRIVQTLPSPSPDRTASSRSAVCCVRGEDVSDIAGPKQTHVHARTVELHLARAPLVSNLAGWYGHEGSLTAYPLPTAEGRVET